jgi:hypothetical protein
MPCNESRLHSHARLSERYFCYYLLLPFGAGRTTIEMSDHILISMALYYRGHDIHAKVVLTAKRTETCPYCLIAIRDNTIMIGQAVRSVQLDRLRVVRRGISAPWLMQREGRGTCALPSLAVHQLFCRNQTGHPITREPHKTRRRRDSTRLERIVGQEPRGIFQSLYKKPLLGARFCTNTNNQPQRLQANFQTTPSKHSTTTKQTLHQHGRLRKLWLLLRQLLLRSRRLLLQRKFTKANS